MGLGVFAGACAIVKTIQLPNLSARSDFPRETIDLFIWTATAGTAILIAGCIPTLRPMFKDIRKRLRNARKRGSRDYSLEHISSPSGQLKPLSLGSSQERIFPKGTSGLSGTFPIMRITETVVEIDAPDVAKMHPSVLVEERQERRWLLATAPFPSSLYKIRLMSA